MALTQNANVGKLNVTVATNSFAVPTPTGYVAGDVLFVVLNVDSKTATVTTPTGWTIDQDISTSLSLGNRTRTYWRVADGTEGASVAFAISANQLGSGAMLGFSGADSINPINGHGTQNNSTSSVSQVAPSITPVVTGGILVCSASAFINGSYTPPTGMTEQSDQANADTTTTVATLAGLTTSATGTKTFTASATSGSIATSTGIRPALATALSVPVGTASGDLMVAQLLTYNAAATAQAQATPSGWTAIDNGAISTGLLLLSTFYRIAGASEPASYTFLTSNATASAGFIQRYAGPWAASPLDAHAMQVNAASTSATAPSVTVAQGGSLAVFMMAEQTSGAPTPPTGYVAEQNAAVPSVLYRTDQMANTAIAAGATGTTSATIASAASVAGVAIFKPLVSTSSRTIPATAAISVSALTRTIPAAAAVKTTSSRAVPATVAVNTPALTRAIPAAAAVKTTLSRAVPATAAISTAVTSARSVPATAAIATPGLTRAVPATTAISVAALTRAVPATAAVAVPGQTRSVPATVAVKTTLSRAVPATVAVKTTLSRSVPATAAITTTLSRAVPATTAISVSALARPVPATAAIATTQARAVPATVSIAATQRRAVPATASISIRAARTVPATASIAARVARSVPVTAAIDFDWINQPSLGALALAPALTGAALLAPAARMTGAATLAPALRGETRLIDAGIDGDPALAPAVAGRSAWSL